jgi:ADP-ribose pyrophosphatase
MSGFPKNEPTVGTRLVYDGDVINVKVDTVRLPNGRETDREIVNYPSSVCVVPVDAQQNVILVRQFRKPAGRFLMEVPAGKMEPGENPEEAATRELQEEIGHAAGRWQLLGAFFLNPSLSPQYTHAYLATDLKLSDLDADDDEFIELRRVPWSDVGSLIAKGCIRDAKSIASLLLAMRVLGHN